MSYISKTDSSQTDDSSWTKKIPAGVDMNQESNNNENEPKDKMANKSNPDLSNGDRRIKDHDIFVGNLSLYTTNERLKSFLEQYGQVNDVRIMFHPATIRSRRFGFATFLDRKSVNDVLALSGSQLFLDGKQLDIRSAYKRIEEELDLPAIKEENKQESQIPKQSPLPHQDKQANKIFVGGIGQCTTEVQLKEYFLRFGRYSDFCLLKDSTGRHRGFAFITFETARSAELASANNQHVIGNKKVEVKLAGPRNNTRPKKLFSTPDQPYDANQNLTSLTIRRFNKQASPDQLYNTSALTAAAATMPDTFAHLVNPPFQSQVSDWPSLQRPPGDSRCLIYPEMVQNYQLDCPPAESQYYSKIATALPSNIPVRYSPYQLARPSFSVPQAAPVPQTPASQMIFQPGMIDPVMNLHAWMQAAAYSGLWPSTQNPQFNYLDYQTSQAFVPRYMFVPPSMPQPSIASKKPE